MPYFVKLSQEFRKLVDWMDVKKEQGAEIAEYEERISKFLTETAEQVEKLPASDRFYEPDTLPEIRNARPEGPRVLPYNLSSDQLYDKMLGAWLGRGAGCVLGIPVEGRSKDWIEAWAKTLGQAYPLDDYFKDYPGPRCQHYFESKDNFIKGKIDHIGQDDDLAYTVLGLVILEEYGIDFTMEDVGKAWVKYLPVACTAERVALDNLQAGMKPPATALKNNPFYEWIGADIRSDPWGYAAPGMPEMAAEFAWRDARVSHVKNGIYGEMFFSAAIAAAFVVDDVKKVLEIALTEIPTNCRMAHTVKQAIEWCETDGDWDKTYKRFAEAYEGMHGAHTLNNAVLTVMGLLYGAGDFEKTITMTVMGGVDTDCTGATAGSIVGAMMGAKNLPGKWIDPLGDRLLSYVTGHEEQKTSDLARRCCAIAEKVRARMTGG